MITVLSDLVVVFHLFIKFACFLMVLDVNDKLLDLLARREAAGLGRIFFLGKGFCGKALDENSRHGRFFFFI